MCTKDTASLLVDVSVFHRLQLLFQNGAENIFLPESTDLLLQDDFKMPAMFDGQIKAGLLPTSEVQFDLAQHFGCTGQNNRTEKKQNSLYKLCHGQTAAVLVQAILPQDGKTKAEHCDPKAPPVILPSGGFLRFQVGYVIVGKHAFWALPFLCWNGICSPRKSAALVMIMQRLLWLSGKKIVAQSAKWKNENISGYSDLEINETMILQWMCNSENLRNCTLQLVTATMGMGALKQSDKETIQHWLQALSQIGYIFTDMRTKLHTNCNSHVVFNPLHVTEHHHGEGPVTPIPNLPVINQMYEKTCPHHMNEDLSVPITFSKPWVQFDNILLLIVFNKPHYESVPHIETLYRPFFPYILYCGPGMPDLNSPNSKLGKYDLSFCPYPPTKPHFLKGAFNYECMAAAITMQFQVEGIFFVADDALVSVQQLTTKSFSHPWYLSTQCTTIADVVRQKECFNGVCNKKYSWYWWRPETKRCVRLVNRMKTESNTSTIGKCYRQLALRNGGVNRLNSGLADVYYIPKKLTSDFLTLSKYFLKLDIWLEIAVPSIIQCTEGINRTQVLLGIWGKKIFSPWLHFTQEKFQSTAFLHPTKWGHVAKGNPKFRDFYCNKVLPWIHDRHGRIPK